MGRPLVINSCMVREWVWQCKLENVETGGRLWAWPASHSRLRIQTIVAGEARKGAPPVIPAFTGMTGVVLSRAWGPQPRRASAAPSRSASALRA